MRKIYVCGPTVYDKPHIGNLRPITTYDLVLKAYRALGKEFQFVHNITDIDDKIINKAKDLNIKESEVSEKYTKEYLELLRLLNIDTITSIEKVTDNITLIENYISRIINKGFAYKDNENNVWFDLNKLDKIYGVVSGQKIDNMIFEDTRSQKKYKGDFALWKNTTNGIKFKTKLGEGRPGWHTECCALIDKHFGAEGVDFHGGGMDLTFPHFENENIQHYSLYKQNIAKNWLKTGQINLEGIKMSKSLGNVFLAEDFIQKFGAVTLKLIFLNSSVAAPINFTNDLLENIKIIKNKYKKVIFYFLLNKDKIQKPEEKNEELNQILLPLSEFDFSQFNYLLNQKIKEFNKTKNINIANLIYKVLDVLLPDLTNNQLYGDLILKFNKWQQLIINKQYKEADAIRDLLIEEGVY
ncbi:class I tRNA ligase family protein [Mycoplasma sp. Mirounga ES2805-ORL]|uniref:class I tRNA ligase family protein n=1 Tax=Mycoplasma sp. Mirounga ES2805-ORL TaxID=754514 RepID=UPI00197B52BC|nr:class I tRNA ligase family protein [Mycoplasma sp. Mirounga ES2805-ORL]QSF13523.1 class I tRNA ligase family protein [Mycoplasma sp. Mirounga ES2805-ORL]